MPSAPTPPNEPSRLATLHRYSILDSLSEPEFDDASALAALICGTPVSLVSLIDQDRQWFKAKVGIDISETPRSQSFCAHTLADSRTLIVPDAQQDNRFADNPLVLGDPNIRFYAGAPIVAPNGHVLGTVCVLDTQPAFFLHNRSPPSKLSPARSWPSSKREPISSRTGAPPPRSSKAKSSQPSAA